jgi:mannose-6-phosphate isomerase-like protein (cupin superfamily)
MLIVKKINISEILSKKDEYWSPIIVADANDHQVRVAKVKGEFINHKHEDSDEVFFVLKGKLNIKTEKGTLELFPGELMVIPKNIYHKPFADIETEILIFEKNTVVNTGNIENKFTKISRIETNI